ncbi:SURP and G-patch domain-containing protein 2 [Bombina bombina]|uniref:SURP and G-patch domain-containing protein 2 n=1 Tax=Bombina bombina TaxID=8345 RepID=UPI00235B0A4C|nr:SURP and G-patch domain-containing protein 2 [Bombina bombina]XP_053558886.1 SURP and G-patch domain-containing protein 2 [Bombina bombina]XP_053558887.1 SURP and G-patch domain-containing protein 2 [Bombina bombina]
MAATRITRKAFDAVVEEKMKRYRISFDEALAETVKQFKMEGSTRMPSEADYRDRERNLDLAHNIRSFDIDPRRDEMQHSSYSMRGQEPSPGRMNDPYLDRLRHDDALVRERLERERLAMIDARLRELDGFRERTDFPRDVDYMGRRWDPMRPDFTRPSVDNYRNLHEQVQPMQDMLRSPGAKGKISKGKAQALKGKAQQRGGRAQQAGEDSINENSPVAKHSMELIRWAKFNTDDDLDKQHATLFRVKTEACKKIVGCFKGPMTSSHSKFCFESVKFLADPALKNPKIDNELLDLLVEKNTVAAKNDFFEVIKPFDKEMMYIQQRLLKSVIPLLIACNTYELKQSFLTDGQMISALKSTVYMCRKSIVLLGQTFTLATISRQNNILDALGIKDIELKPEDYPNFTDSFLFGKKFMAQLKAWLSKSGNKLVLRTKALTEKAVEKELPVKESKEKKAADPAAVEAIDKLMEYAKEGVKTEGEKPAFWYLFDVNSNEFKYYHQKLAEFQKATGHVCETTTQTKTIKKAHDLTGESLRAALYAKAAQGAKRKTLRSYAYSKQKKQQAGAQALRAAQEKDRRTMRSIEFSMKQKKQQTGAKKKKVSASNMEVVKEEQISDQPSTASTSSPSETPTSCLPKSPENVMPESSDQESLDVDDKTKDTATKLAEFVAQMGPEIEQFSMENSKNNPEFWFLHDKNSPAYQFYQSKVREFQSAAEAEGYEDEDYDGVEMDADSEGAETQSNNPLAAAFSQMPTPALPPLPRKRVTKLKVGMIPPKRVRLVDEPNVHDPVRIEYERPRGRPVKRAKKPVDLEFANKKITQANVGFQLLSKMGWKEGQGLGSSASGIVNPIKVGTVSSGEGFGMEGTSESQEDNFDVFRQRMMQMYKQKLK